MTELEVFPDTKVLCENTLNIVSKANENSRIYPLSVGEEYDLSMDQYFKLDMDIE